MDKETIPQPIQVDMNTLMFPVFNRSDRRKIARDLGRKVDVHARRKCAGPSQPLPPEQNEYAKLQAQRKHAGRVAQTAGR